jgi:toxin CptA
LSQKFDSPVYLKIKASKILTGLLLAVHLVDLVILFFLPLHFGLRLLLAVVVLASLAYTVAVHGLRFTPHSITEVHLSSDNLFQVRLGNKEKFVTAEIQSQFIAASFAILSLKLENNRWPRSLLVLSDAVHADDFRRFRARLILRSAME